MHKRGTAIVETEKGILLVAGNNKEFMLPGGQAKKHETRTQAAMRELREETGLKSDYANPLFNHEGTSNSHTVVKVKSFGRLRPRNEVKYILWYKPGKETNIKISNSSKEILNKYLKWKKENNSIFKKIKNYYCSPKIRFEKPKWHRCEPPDWVRKKLITDGVITGKHFKYKLHVWIGTQQGETEWKYYKKELI